MPETPRPSEKSPELSAEAWTTDEYFHFAKVGMERQIREIEQGKIKEQGKDISLFSRALEKTHRGIQDPLNSVAESVSKLLIEEWDRAKSMNAKLDQWEAKFYTQPTGKYRSNVKMFYWCCEQLPPGTPQSFKP